MICVARSIVTHLNVLVSVMLEAGKYVKYLNFLCRCTYIQFYVKVLISWDYRRAVTTILELFSVSKLSSNLRDYLLEGFEF